MGRRPLNHEMQRQLNALQRDHADVLYVQGDVSNYRDVDFLLQQAHEKFGHLDGVFHAAGVADLTPAVKATHKLFADVLAPKIQGTLNIDIATKQELLDFFVVFLLFPLKLVIMVRVATPQVTASWIVICS